MTLRMDSKAIEHCFDASSLNRNTIGKPNRTRELKPTRRLNRLRPLVILVSRQEIKRRRPNEVRQHHIMVDKVEQERVVILQHRLPQQLSVQLGVLLAHVLK